MSNTVRYSGRRFSRPWCLLFPSLVVVLFIGCSARHYREDADREVYGIIAAKQVAVHDEARPFSIDSGERDAVLPESDRLLTLSDAVVLAFLNNRDYQSQKESVYIDALRLSKERDDFRPTFFSGIGLEAERDSDDDISGSVDADFSISKLFENGATVTLDFATALSQFLVGSPERAASSLFSFSFLQPLLRNAGRLITLENLTQAERDVVYQLRSFARYQKSFVVRVASEYYRVLELINRVENERGNYERLKTGVLRAEALAEEGRLAAYQVDQARQDELSARNRWIDAQERYSRSLDDFKITLGIPTDHSIELDPSEFERLVERGLVHPDMAAGEAVAVALAHRLDLMTNDDQVEDAARKVRVAAKALEPEASLRLDANIGTHGDSKPLNFDLDREGTYSLGFDLDLPIERTSERNAYRLALINLARARRDWSLARDEVKLGVRDAHRRLEQARENYEIQKMSVALAETRVESTTMLLDVGRVETRDVLDAQSALVVAQNALTSALVSHAVARLEFFRDMGVLDVREEDPYKAVSSGNGVADSAAEPPAEVEGE